MRFIPKNRESEEKIENYEDVKNEIKDVVEYCMDCGKWKQRILGCIRQRCRCEKMRKKVVGEGE
jgi:hypothetical protein